jgi:arylsulfatase A-like enzyme
LRPDRLGCYGYGRGTSPNIDRLASRASLFENAYSSAPFTFEAVPRFMQSSYWDGNFPTWTHVLKQNGYRAVGVRSPRLLRRYVKGVDSKQSKREKNTDSAMDVMIEAFEATPRGTPFLGFMHVPDPHWVYAPHSEFNFGESDSDRYDGEIAYADHHIGRLLTWLETTGRLEETIIVITSDHGESFGERGVYLHGTQLYDEQMRAPIIIHVPGQAPRRVRDYVSTIDLGTTILSLVGISPPTGYIGVSLGPLMRGEPFAHPPVFGEHNYREVSRLVPYESNLNPERRTYMVITQDGYKLIYHREWYGFELFDLKSDPRETRNLYDRMPEKASELEHLLGRFVDVVTASRPKDSDERRFPPGNQSEEDDEVEQD